MDNAFTRGAGDARGGGGRVHRLGRLDPARDRNAEYVYGNASRFCALIRSVVTSALPQDGPRCIKRPRTVGPICVLQTARLLDMFFQGQWSTDAWPEWVMLDAIKTWKKDVIHQDLPTNISRVLEKWLRQKQTESNVRKERFCRHNGTAMLFRLTHAL